MQRITKTFTTFASKFFNFVIKHGLKDERGRGNSRPLLLSYNALFYPIVSYQRFPILLDITRILPENYQGHFNSIGTPTVSAIP